MKNTVSKKLQLGKIKISNLTQSSPAGQPNQLMSNTSCRHICPINCSLNCTTTL